MARENFKVTSKEDGKEYWISRSVAVAIVVYGFPPKPSESGSEFSKESSGVFLVHRRGPGCPDNIGKWSTNCGYIGWGESVAEAAVRELYEETGLEIPASHLRFIGYNDPVGDGKENVTLRFVACLPKSLLENGLKTGKINTNTSWRGGEEEEISEFRLIDQYGIYELAKEEDWAFQHDKLLLEALGEVNKMEEL